MSDAWLSGFTADRFWRDTCGRSRIVIDAPNTPDADPTKTVERFLGDVVDRSFRAAVGGQFRADYADEFDALTGIGGELILESTSRWGIDASAQYLRERLPGDGYDHLTIGDCNLVYRFAQGPQAQMRVGLGANWLNDATRTDLGFNFTYGGDFLSAETLGAVVGDRLGHARPRRSVSLPHDRRRDLQPVSRATWVRVSRHRHDPEQFPRRRRPRLVLSRPRRSGVSPLHFAFIGPMERTRSGETPLLLLPRPVVRLRF